MMKKTACLLLLCLVASSDLLADNNYIYRQRVNWVKLVKPQSEDVPAEGIHHPYTSLSTEQMEAMLLSIKISRKHLLKKEIDSVDVFNSWEARKYAPMLVEALAKASNEEVVNFSIVHKRPFFILRNDRLTMGNVFVAKDGIHFQFNKLFAQLTGDYEASSQMDRALKKAKTLRVTLEAGEGQTLSYANAMEVIMSPSSDFIARVQNNELKEAQETKESMKGNKKKPDGVIAAPVATSGGGDDAAARLRKLENLKSQKLISEKEYQELRAKILSDL